jgi:hypothetical protein
MIVFPLLATGAIDSGGKFAASINDTIGFGGNFGPGVVDTGGKFEEFEVTLTP